MTTEQQPIKLKGRAGTPIRPGIAIRDVLMGRIPLEDGRYVTEASVTDLHHAYKLKIRAENESRGYFRPRNGQKPSSGQKPKLHGMNVHSFATLFRFAKYIGLVELVREEPSKSNLYRVENGTGLHIVAGTKKIFRLTDKGKDSTVLWSNLKKSWYLSRQSHQ